MDEIKDKVLEIINSLTECDAIVIFGSYARGTDNDESDIDIAIKVREQISKTKLYEIKEILEEKLKRDIDLINLDNVQNDGFKYEILINGKTIYCKDEYKFDLYKLDAYREYLELNEARKDIVENIRKGGI